MVQPRQFKSKKKANSVAASDIATLGSPALPGTPAAPSRWEQFCTLARQSSVPDRGRLDFDFGPADEPDLVNKDIKVDDRVNQTLHAGYVKTGHGSAYKYIRDRRVKQLHGSLSTYVLELCGIEDPSAELLSVFSQDELDRLKTSLGDMIEVSTDLFNDNNVTKSIMNRVRAAFKYAHQCLLMRATIIVTTVSIGTDRAFNLYRRSHAVQVEEVGRAGEVETAGVLSQYWNASVVGLVGSHQPMAFGPALENPFQKQVCLSLLARLVLTGFYVR
ncbi:hypothetical protein N0V95_007434 [Ascochyta clinopodiicola]|nr:hypothetical protein N0V95_007434 [Ascochyta clinopodiicola]